MKNIYYLHDIHKITQSKDNMINGKQYMKNIVFSLNNARRL